MRGLTSAIVAGIFYVWLLAGCATRNSSPASSAFKPASISVVGPEAISTTNTVRNSVTKHQFQNKTPFEKYDSAIVEAVEKRWGAILDSQKFKVDRSGKVVMRFHLNQDGTVSNVKTMENSAGYVLRYLCSQAIKDAAPFAHWPPDMVKMVNQEYREITFTFYYQ
jgi:hypothetical protein